MPKHIMVDIETLGVNSGCIICSIGACQFDEGGIKDTFTADLDMHSQEAAGLKVETRTLEWWLGQGLTLAGRFNTKASDQCLVDFAQWLGEHRDRAPRCLWANSPQFDFAILEGAYKAFGIGSQMLPWRYWELRDYRTAVRMLDRPWMEIKKQTASASHRALQDAVDQAETLIRFGFFERWKGEF